MASLTREVQQKISDKYDTALEARVQEWIEAEIGEMFPSNFADSLRDGVILCKLINRLRPDTIPTINTSKMPFKQLENINQFIAAAKVLGLKDHQVFHAVDLFEKKNLTQVLQALYNLSKAVGKDIGGDGAPMGGPEGFDFTMFQKKGN